MSARAQSLLPANRTSFEEAMDLAGARAGELSVTIPKLIRPWETPSSHLSWLAWGLSVDLWDKDWDLDKTRSLAAWSLPMHAAKGTEASIAEHVRITGAEPKRFVVPPATTYLMNALTNEQRQAYLARFAQLRIYPFVARGIYRFGHFTNKAFGRRTAFVGASCLLDVHSYGRYVRTAKLWDRGVETPLTIRAVTPEGMGKFHVATYDEVVLGAKPTRAIHLGAPPLARAFLVDDFGVARRIVRISREASYSYRLGRETYTTVMPKAGLIDIRPQHVAECHVRQWGTLFAANRQFIRGKLLPPSIAWRFLYERWHIHDPKRVPDVRARSTHLGATRLGMPAYTAELRTRITGRKPSRVVSRFVSGHLLAQSRKPIADVRDAVLAAKSLRDRILIDTKTWRFPRAGDRRALGTVQLGRYIEA